MNCLDPQIIRNRYTGIAMYVPCGKCEACKVQKSIDATSRLNVELSNYNVSLFVTLTYDNKFVPFVIPGSKFIYRLCDDGNDIGNYVSIVEKMDEPVKVKSYSSLNKFPVDICPDHNAIGVIYYRDIQLFFKRLRKQYFLKYGRYIKFRVATTLEYGTVTKRPHAHIVFGFRSKEVADFTKSILYKCWRYCDRYRLEKYSILCSRGISHYMASYISGYIGSNEISNIKRFRPRFRRSNEVYYGLDPSDVQALKEVIERNYGKEVFDFVREDFYRIRRSSNNNVTSGIIPTNVFRAFFYPPKGFYNFSFVSFRLCAYRIFRISRYKSKFGRCPEFEEDLSSADLTFFRCYRRFCILISLNVYDVEVFENYLQLFYKISAFYASCLLRDQMMLFEKMSPQDYLKYCYNSFADVVLTPAYIRSIYRSLGLHKYNDSEFHTHDELVKIKSLVINNKQKLLGKHVKDLTTRNYV